MAFKLQVVRHIDKKDEVVNKSSELPNDHVAKKIIKKAVVKKLPKKLEAKKCESKIVGKKDEAQKPIVRKRDSVSKKVVRSKLTDDMSQKDLK